MRTIATWLAAGFLNSLWQVPLVFCAAWLAARMARPLGAHAEHRIWVGALLLESVLPFCRFHPQALGRQVLLMMQEAAFGTHGRGIVLVDVGQAQAVGTHWLVGGWLIAFAAIYAALLLVCLARLGMSAWRTRRLLASAEEIEPAGAMAQRLLEFCRAFGVPGAAVRMAWAPAVPGPATMGLWRHTLLLPEGFAGQVGDDEMEAVLAHEFAHIERRDFAKNLLYELLALPVAYHPLLALTRAQVNETRELVCDARAARALAGESRYARSLLRLASLLAEQAAACPQHAMGIFDTNIFERRVMQLMRKRTATSGMRRLAIVAGCALIAGVASLSAMALQTDVPAAQEAVKGTPTKVSPKEMERNLISKVNPVYPLDAKAAHVQGKVVLKATVGRDGHMKYLHVVSGPAMLQQSAMDAVRQWVYKPYLLNGEPVEVVTEINVIYTLADKGKQVPEK